MQKINFQYSLVIALLAVTLLIPIAVSAQNADAGNSSGGATAGSGSENSVVARLTDRKLAICQNREQVMNNIMARIGDRGQKQINVINSIQEKVQNFYTDKEITVENYDALMATVTTKKQVATTAMNNVRLMKGTFSCSGENPKGVAVQFKSQAATQSAAMKEYRDAVHALAVSIKTALGDSQAVVEEN